jgi:hypothetical protein
VAELEPGMRTPASVKRRLSLSIKLMGVIGSGGDGGGLGTRIRAKFGKTGSGGSRISDVVAVTLVL